MVFDFDVIVIGGGHAGIEAAYASAKMGAKTLLITLNLDNIGLMPCNPSIGGVGKGHIVFEISALGGLMPKLCTKTYLQARLLNTKKGPAVQGLRLQVDKTSYSILAKNILEKTKNLNLFMGMVEEILVDENNKVYGIKSREGGTYLAPNVIVTAGTFLNGVVHIGKTNYFAGRQGEESSIGLSASLKKLGLRMSRLKTGTPPRLLKSSIDFSQLEPQTAHDLPYLYEFYSHPSKNKLSCYIARTNEQTHKIINNNIKKSALYSGNISGVGPRYCPSIEDKIMRFSDRSGHNIFVEPESESSLEIYPSGVSTSLPLDVQKQYIRSIKGFENAIITRPGYAIEYDFVHPEQLKHTLEVKNIDGLFLAGQVNGTTGYEEAAGQGLIAGINAALKVQNKAPFIIQRHEGYIGVMIDDLISLGVDEPYRMFTSRAERRLILRQDNAFLRLMDKSHALGLIDNQLFSDFKQEKDIFESTMADLRKNKSNIELLRLFGEFECDKDAIRKTTKKELSERNISTIYAEIKYYEYIQREKKEIEKFVTYKSLKIPNNFDYKGISGLSSELQQKLIKHKPEDIAQASLIPGITPAAISLLIFKVRQAQK